MKKIKIIALIIAAVMTLSVFMPLAYAGEVDVDVGGLLPEGSELQEKGTCGDNLAWALYDNGTLVISGTGAMTDYSSYSSVPWYGSRTKIKTVTFGSGVTSIGDRAFAYCTALLSVTIPDGITSIGRSAFTFCTGLESAEIGIGVTSIGVYAFSGCPALAGIEVAEGNTAYKGIDGVLFNKAGTTLIQYPAGCKDTEYTIPKGVKSIGDHAFFFCTDLESLTIGTSVKSIEDYAFLYFFRLSDIYYTGKEEQWNAITKGDGWDEDAGSDVDGYTVHFLEIEDVEDTLYGDVNGDDKITALDNAYLARYLAKWTGYDDTMINTDAADVNGDNKITALDNAVLARYLAKWTGYDVLPYTVK